MSLLPFIKEAFFNYKSTKTPLNFGVLVALVIMIAVFFLQADVINSLYRKNRALAEIVRKNTDIIAGMARTAETNEMNCRGEINSLRAILSTQAHFLSLCGTTEKNKEEP